MSPSESESDSASLRSLGVAKLPEMLKPDTCWEATGTCTCRAPRGGWEERAQTDTSRNLGDPLRLGHRAGGPSGIHNREACRGWESERPIVARKRGNACGAKGPCLEHAESDERSAAWTEVPLRNNLSFGVLKTYGILPALKVSICL
ncbi:MAG: hypothetical protein GY864_06925 [Desulfobacterales bacterium]|nr:hypothetical protein [Desulfobacterales bacterium]